ncbi:glycosyl transferase family protein [Novosphingobium sp. 9]|uniref:glycosyl transferase family protein n=1 Tax=Novosphingobium sp. 9 TaxID=2025349 RepID=UPI0021B659B4|nr:glycosyl transferase family protein [Novosphingobium sp. 9]
MDTANIIGAALAALQTLERELLLFSAFWVLVGAFDDLVVDGIWLWLKVRGRTFEHTLRAGEAQAELQGHAAVLIAAWQEAQVIGHTIAHARLAWAQSNMRLYIGCYPNDADTIMAAMAGAGGDARIRIVVHDQPGPTTKADCLNRLYVALCADERAQGMRYRAVLLHDSEDMVHPAELAVIDAALDRLDFVQLPVRPEPQVGSRWVAGHYIDEFAEAHGKAMAVRDAVGAGIPAAGVGCGFSRRMLARIAERRLRDGECGPFAADCLTEDYELGLLVGREGGAAGFLRIRDETGQLVATRAYFPASFDAAIRQKARWVHGIAFQSWERLGWDRSIVDRWMALRDRKGPMTALVFACGYMLVIVEALLAYPRSQGLTAISSRPLVIETILWACMMALVWRGLFRIWFTAREYGLREGMMAIARIPVGNAIAILAARRALLAYARTLYGQAVRWDKTVHDRHPVQALAVDTGPPRWNVHPRQSHLAFVPGVAA